MCISFVCCFRFWLGRLSKYVSVVLMNMVISRDCNISLSLLQAHPFICKSLVESDLQMEGYVWDGTNINV